MRTSALWTMLWIGLGGCITQPEQESTDAGFEGAGAAVQSRAASTVPSRTRPKPPFVFEYRDEGPAVGPEPRDPVFTELAAAVSYLNLGVQLGASFPGVRVCR